EKERLWVCNPAHPIARGIDRYFEIENVEMYGEPFAVPTPEEIVFISWFEGGEVFRSGCTWKRGNGKIFYFRPGHEAYPIYYNKNVRLVLRNAVRWAVGDGVKWITRTYPRIVEWKGRVGESAKTLAEVLEFEKRLDLKTERVYHFASLQLAEDSANNDYLARFGQLQNLMTKLAEASAFVVPEIQ